MTIELSEKDIKVLMSALDSYIRDDDIFFDVSSNYLGLHGREYKATRTVLKTYDKSTKYYTWEDLVYLAEIKGGDWAKAKENAENQMAEYIGEKFKVSIYDLYEDSKSVIQSFLQEKKEIDRFDIDGNMTVLYTEEVAQ